MPCARSRNQPVWGDPTHRKIEHASVASERGTKHGSAPRASDTKKGNLRSKIGLEVGGRREDGPHRIRVTVGSSFYLSLALQGGRREFCVGRTSAPVSQSIDWKLQELCRVTYSLSNVGLFRSVYARTQIARSVHRAHCTGLHNEYAFDC